MTPAEGVILVWFAVLVAVVFGLWLLAFGRRPRTGSTLVVDGGATLRPGVVLEIGGRYYQVVQTKESDRSVTVRPVAMDTLRGRSIQ